VRLDPVGYQERPFSHLIRVAVTREEEREPLTHLFLKITKPKAAAEQIDIDARVARDFETTRAIYDFMTQWSDSGVIRPVACYKDLRAIVTEESPGDTLLEALQRQASWFPSTSRRATLEAILTNVGLWLRRFQGYDAREATISPESLLEYVDIRLRRLVSHAVITAPYRQRVLDHLCRLADRIPSTALRDVAVHADFAPGNILLAQRGIVVLDFAMTGRGTYLHDISRLHLQLDLLCAKPQFRPGTIEALQSALLRGLDPELTTGHPLFRYLLLMHRINNLGTLALKHERFPSSVLSSRVQRLHRRSLDRELATSGASQ
jgi:hypothetical protein